MVLLLRRGYTTIKYQADINGEDLGGDNSEGKDEGGKGGNSGRGNEDNSDDGDNGGDSGDDVAKVTNTTIKYYEDNGNGDKDGGNKDAKWRQSQQGWHLPPSTTQCHRPWYWRETYPS